MFAESVVGIHNPSPMTQALSFWKAEFLQHPLAAPLACLHTGWQKDSWMTYREGSASGLICQSLNAVRTIRIKKVVIPDG